MKTLLITGGAGFMGSNMVRYLYEKYPSYKIVVLDLLTYAGNLENIPRRIIEDRHQFSFWYGNVRNAELVDSLVSGADAVIHFAAETHVTRSIYDNYLFYETDVLGTQVVANAVVKYKHRVERLIHISTSEVYGTAVATLIDEEHPLMPTSPYASAKAGADRLIYSYFTTYGMPAVIVRPFNNYGPYQHLEKVIPRFTTSCILGEPLSIHGDGRSRRDWLYVEDLCKALDRILHCDIEKIKGEVINIGSGRDVEVITIANMILERLKKPRSLIAHISDRPGQVPRQTACVKKAEKLLGWKPETTFEAGLDKTIEWYRTNRAWWEKHLWMRTIPIFTEEGKVEYY